MSAAPETVEITTADAASDFRSGVEALDAFFHSFATQNQRRGVSRTWVLRRPANRKDLPAVLGFYSLSVGSIARSEMPVDLVKRLPRYPVPIILIARLARDERTKGLGIGPRLLRDAHVRASAVQDQAGGVAVIVDAKDERANTFYRQYGYEPLTADAGWPRRLFLPLATIRKALAPGS